MKMNKFELNGNRKNEKEHVEHAINMNIIKYYARDAYNKFPDFFRIGTFIDSTHMKL